jgi:hypothetical protein
MARTQLLYKSLAESNRQNKPDTEPTSTQEDGFTEVRRRKRQNSDNVAQTSKKAAPAAASAHADAPSKVATRNFFTPLRTTTMDTDSSGSESTPQEETVPEKTCRPPTIILSSAANLIQLQKQLKNVVKEDFEFRNTRSGTRVITRGMADFLAVKSHFEGNKLSFYTFFPKSEKPIKAVMPHLPINTPAKDNCDRLVSLGLDVVSVKQMTTTHRSPPDDPKILNLPLFLVTLPRTAKSQQIFQLPSLCHIAIKWRHIERRKPSRSATIISSSATSGQTANSLPVVYCAGAATCTKSAPKKKTLPPLQLVVTAS